MPNAMATSNGLNLYEVIEHAAKQLHAISDGDGLLTEPLEVALEQTEKAAAAVWEFLAHENARAIIDVLNGSQPNGITLDQIGLLLLWANAIRDYAEDIVEEMAKVVVAVHESGLAMATGYHGDGTMFDAHATPEDRDDFQKRARRFGFNA